MVNPRNDASIDADVTDGSSDASIDADHEIQAHDAEDVRPPTGSCQELRASNPSLPSGDYTIIVNRRSVSVFCDMESGGWTRVVRFDAAADACPGEWVSGRENTVCLIPSPSCDGAEASAFFDSPQGPYSEVRGFIRAYQYFSTDAFSTGGADIDGFYVDGISITRGDSPRSHIWTLASGLYMQNGPNACPCLGGTEAPSFVGTHYFCDSGNPGPSWDGVWYDADPLWDGGESGEDGSCATLGSPAWFERTFDSSRLAPIEVRILQDGCDENIGIFEMELYVR